MTPMLPQMILSVLATISLSNCAKAPPIPKVTLHQIDTRNDRANPFRITRYNAQTCELELQDETSFRLSSSKVLHGGVCLTKEDYAALQTAAKTACRNANEN